MAHDKMSRRNFHVFRFRCGADIHGFRTPPAKLAAFHHSPCIRCLSLEDLTLFGEDLARHRHDIQKRPAVRMHRISDDFVRSADFHDFSQIHDGDPVRNQPCQRQIMGDEQVGHTLLIPLPEHHLHDAGPDACIQHGYRFIRHHELRFHNQRACNGGTLPLSA